MKRSIHNPILTREDLVDVPPHFTDPTSAFNPGAIKDGELYRLMLRVQARSRETFLVMASSRDGVHFEVAPRIVEIDGLGAVDATIFHVYDPRLTRIDDQVYLMFAADTQTGCCLGTAVTRDFERFELIAMGTAEDTRNGVLFPERRGGKFLRLERPNRIALDGGPTSGETIVLSESADLVSWRPRATVMSGRPHYWDERIGSGPPPVKTHEGWLHLYHGVATHFQSSNIYQAGCVLLDLDDPAKVLARTRHNLLEPRTEYELTGQVPNVVFPSGWIVEPLDADGFAAAESTVYVSYGAADTCVALASTTVGELCAACRESAGDPGG